MTFSAFHSLLPLCPYSAKVCCALVRSVSNKPALTVVPNPMWCCICVTSSTRFTWWLPAFSEDHSLPLYFLKFVPVSRFERRPTVTYLRTSSSTSAQEWFECRGGSPLRSSVAQCRRALFRDFTYSALNSGGPDNNHFNKRPPEAAPCLGTPWSRQCVRGPTQTHFTGTVTTSNNALL